MKLNYTEKNLHCIKSYLHIIDYPASTVRLFPSFCNKQIRLSNWIYHSSFALCTCIFPFFKFPQFLFGNPPLPKQPLPLQLWLELFIHEVNGPLLSLAPGRPPDDLLGYRGSRPCGTSLLGCRRPVSQNSSCLGPDRCTFACTKGSWAKGYKLSCVSFCLFVGGGCWVFIIQYLYNMS